MIQAKSDVDTPDEPFEQEADRVAERVMRMPDGGRRSLCACGGGCARCRPDPSARDREPIRTKRIGAGDTELLDAPPSVHDVLRSTGQPLDSATLRFFEPRFGHAFDDVRVHTGPSASAAASDIGARAFTAGRDIVFGPGEFGPRSHDGQQLLAHELTHVVQQESGQARRSLQRKPVAGKAKPGAQTTSFRIRVDRQMTASELLHEFVRQYYGYTTEAQIATKLRLWINSSQTATTAEDVARGYIDASVTTEGQTDFQALPAEEKQAVNTETDRRFWDATGYKPGEKLGSSPQDKQMAQVWMGVRNAVLTEDKQRKAIEALPDDIKSVLFAGGADSAAAQPQDFTQLLNIAQKLAKLTAEERKDYLDRVNDATTSLDALEASVDTYIKFRAARTEQEKETDKAAMPLLNADHVYDTYRFWQVYLKGVGEYGAGDTDEDQEFAEALAEAHRTALLQELKTKGFDSIEAFEATIEAYRVAFRTQAVNLALDVLAHYEHMLFQERTKFATPAAAADIAKGIAATNAAALYKESHEQEDISSLLQTGHDIKETWWIKPKLEADRKAAEARASAEAAVIRGSGNDPLVAERKTDREKLAGLDAAGTQTYLLETLNKRAEDARTARKEFQDDPDRVFKLPDLIAASEQLQGIDEDSVYGKIIKHHIDDEHARHLLSSIAMGILALALAFLVPGGGWIAAAALVANAGLSTYQAVVAYQEYEEQERDYTLHFLSQEPSLFWVGVAIAAAALDLGMATSALIKQSAVALKALEGPLVEFSKGGELTTLLSKIEAAEGLKGEVKVALQREAEAAAAAREAWKDVGKGTFMLTPGVMDPGQLRAAFRALYYSVKRGVTTIVRLRKDAKLLEALGDITRMTGAERAELETAFDEVKQMVQTGKARGMDDSALLDYVDRWAVNRSKAGFRTKLLDEMSHWKPLTPEQERALGALAERKEALTGLREEQQALLEEREQLKAQQADRSTRTDANRERLLEVNQRLGELDPKFKQATVKQKVSTVNADGEVVERLIDVPVEHPPGEIAKAESALSAAEKEAARVELTLYDRLRAATPSPAARERTLKGVTVDQVGKLKTKPAGLHPDHIISVNEIADMDGFSKLPWKDQKEIADMSENLIAMDSAANASKGDRTVRAWRQASNFYEADALENMVKREIKARAAIEAEIQNRLAKLAAGTL